jgi:cytochrome c
MKKSIVILGLCAVFMACNSKSSTSGNADSTASANQTAKTQNPEVDTNANKTGAEAAGGAAAPGLKLIAASDCNSCHKADIKLVGPAFKAIAEKYSPVNEAKIDTLVNKIIKGGKGNWGDIPMTPHPTISPSDAKEMVKYILSVK